MEGSLELDRAAPLYDKVVPTRVRLPDRDELVMDLTVRILSGTRLTHGSRDRLLHVELTDDEGVDPTAVHTFEVTEEEYHVLKAEQQLLVDFATFPTKFTELLDHCVDAALDEPASSEAGGVGPRFLAILDARERAADATFTVLESNLFKHLSHLSLRVRAGDDASVKRYLAERLKQVQTHARELRAECDALRATNERGQQEAERVVAELARSRSAMERAEEDARTARAKDVAELKESMLEQQGEQQRAQAAELRAVRARVAEELAHARARAETAESRNLELMEQRAEMEARVRELEVRTSTHDSEIAESRAEMERLRELNRQLDAAKFESEKTSSRHTVRESALQQQVADKEELLEKTASLLEAASAAKSALEEQLASKSGSSAKMADKLERSIAEINRGNEIIKRIQGEHRSTKAKLKLKQTVVRQQERLLAERERAADEARQEANGVRARLSAKEGEADALRTELAGVQRKLEESAELIASNQQVISYLNKEVNDAQMARRSPGSASGAAYAFKPTIAPTGAGIHGALSQGSPSGASAKGFGSAASAAAAPSPGDAALWEEAGEPPMPAAPAPGPSAPRYTPGFVPAN